MSRSINSELCSGGVWNFLFIFYLSSFPPSPTLHGLILPAARAQAQEEHQACLRHGRARPLLLGRENGRGAQKVPPAGQARFFSDAALDGMHALLFRALLGPSVRTRSTLACTFLLCFAGGRAQLVALDSNVALLVPAGAGGVQCRRVPPPAGARAAAVGATIQKQKQNEWTNKRTQEKKIEK